MDKSIIVICGGLSEEREVSLRSGANVHSALQRLGYTNAELFDFKDDNSLIQLIEKKHQGKFDKAFVITHGTYGEDGCIQGFLELIGISYTGSNVETSAICMNKTRTKEILSAHNLPVLKTYLAKEVYEDKTDLDNDTAIIFKPNVGGSSVGVTKFNNKAEFKTFIDANIKVKNEIEKYLVEKFIRGTEVTTSIIKASLEMITENKNHCKAFNKDGKALVSLPILELRPKNEIYDYEAKYTPGMTEFVLPAAISAELEEQIHTYALEAFYQLDCKGAARVDFIIDGKTNKPYILEVNTLPGMTDTSDLPAQARSAGISYDEVVNLILNCERRKVIESLSL